MPQNALYCGDNLEVLREHVKDESVDLVYLDPPFNSNATYNVLFAEQDGTRAAAQIKAFDDTWTWDRAAAGAYQEVVEAGGPVSRVMQAFRTFLGDNDVLAYLAMMAPRLQELYRALKPTGSLYLHCDPTASHYLKLLLDAIFGVLNFKNEIVWKRSSAHSDTKQGRKQHGRIHDLVFFYTKGESWTWNAVYTPYDPTYLESEYRHVAPDGRRFKKTDLTAAKPGGDTEYAWNVKRKAGAEERWQPDLEHEHASPKRGTEYRAVKPYKGRYWAYSKDNLVRFWEQGRLYHGETGMPRLMQFAGEMPGVALQDVWTDIPPIGARAKERLSYPTQKPEALLERIVLASSNEGDVVLDPFCGCGTTVAVAERLGRRWIGIDVTHIAITLLKHRLFNTFGDAPDYEVMGEPVSLPDARALAELDRHQFEWWALGLVDARPDKKKKGADQGIDGRLYFHDSAETDRAKEVIVSVKSGTVTAPFVRDLHGVIEREGAAIGVLITLKPPTKAMKKEAASAGFYEPPLGGTRHPRLQILTIEELLSGARVDRPPWRDIQTFKKAPKATRARDRGNDLPFTDSPAPTPEN